MNEIKIPNELLEFYEDNTVKYIKEFCGEPNEHKQYCITKEESPFGSFICMQNEQFELYEE